MIDPLITGVWLATANSVYDDTGTFEISALGEKFLLSPPISYVIENSGMTLRHTIGNPLLIYQRAGSFGSGLIGLWRREELDGGVLYGEEYLYREDGSFSYHGTRDGAPDFDFVGTFEDTGSELIERQHRSSLVTGANATMAEISFFFGPLAKGTYTVAPDGRSWDFDAGIYNVHYQRLP